jgi:putative copper export protein
VRRDSGGFRMLGANIQRTVPMDWVVVVVQWLHVLLGIIWFGNALAVAAILIPTLNPLPLPVQRQVGGSYGERATRLFDVVVPLIIVLGIIRGTLLGPIRDLETLFGTAYGITWLVALVVAVATGLWSRFVITPAIRHMNGLPLNADGSAPPELGPATDRVKRVVVLELAGFFVIFTCMILMRFGL